MKNIKFTKMVATGNDFVVVDNRLSAVSCQLAAIAKKLCARKTEIGADGLLVLEKSKKADFKMRIFNPDGSEPNMCGNGSRCIALYAKLKKIAPPSMRIETRAGLLTAEVSGDRVKINMTDPDDIRLSISLKVAGKSYRLHHINTGVPHAVYFTRKIDALDINTLGREVRHNRYFKPQGVNFNAVQILSKNAISIRTYERGVEHETLACGTGAAASAIIASIMNNTKSFVSVYTKGGELKIYFKRKDAIFSDVFLKGEAREVFSGEINV